MAITYPLSLPTTSGLASVSLQYYCGNSIIQSPWTGQTQVQATEADYWLADITLPPMDVFEFGPWRAFLAALRGQLGTFLLGDPTMTSPTGIASGTPRVDGASQSGFTLATKDWTASQTGILKAGDYIQLGQRLYMIVEDADSDGDGDATLEIRPRLREAPGDGDGITTTSCKGLFRLSNNTAPIVQTAGDSLQYSISFAAIEAI